MPNIDNVIKNELTTSISTGNITDTLFLLLEVIIHDAAYRKRLATNQMEHDNSLMISYAMVFYVVGNGNRPLENLRKMCSMENSFLTHFLQSLDTYFDKQIIKMGTSPI